MTRRIGVAVPVSRTNGRLCQSYQVNSATAAQLQHIVSASPTLYVQAGRDQTPGD